MRFTDSKSEDELRVTETILQAVKELGLEHVAAESWREAEADIYDLVNRSLCMVFFRIVDDEVHSSRSNAAAKLVEWRESWRARPGFVMQRGAAAPD